MNISNSYYELKIDALTRLDKIDPSKNYAAAALQVGEPSRARTLLETLAEAGADIRQGVGPDLLERERAIEQPAAAVDRKWPAGDRGFRLERIRAARLRSRDLTSKVHERQA